MILFFLLGLAWAEEPARLRALAEANVKSYEARTEAEREQYFARASTELLSAQQGCVREALSRQPQMAQAREPRREKASLPAQVTPGGAENVSFGVK